MAFGSDVVCRVRIAQIDYLAIWQKAGVPTPDILRAFTTNGFELLRLENELGPIASGRAGDLIAVPENPLQDIQVSRKVNFVMKEGKVIKARVPSENPGEAVPSCPAGSPPPLAPASLAWPATHKK